MKYAVDFDRTLITFHYSDFHTLQDLLDGRRHSLCLFLQTALNSGHEVGIVTFNHRTDTIQEFVKRIWPHHAIPVIGYLPNTIDQGKTEHIRKLYPNTDPENICLVDDSFHNIEVAIKEGFKTWYIKD